MKTIITALSIAMTTILTCQAGEPDAHKTPIKPVKVTVVTGIRENTTIPGDYVSFKCHFSPNKVCLFKIETAGRAGDDKEECQSKDVNPETFPAVFEPEGLYLGLIGPSGDLRVFPIRTFETTNCTQESTTVVVSPKIEIGF